MADEAAVGSFLMGENIVGAETDNLQFSQIPHVSIKMSPYFFVEITIGED